MSDLFSAQPADPNGNTTAGVTTTGVPSTYDDLLGSIKNERGEPKYKNVAEALIGLAHAQNYIPQLKQELANKDNELTTLRTSSVSPEEYQKLVQKLTTQGNPEPTTTSVQIDEEGIARIVEQKLTANQQKQQSEANQRAVVDAVKAKFGDKGSEVFYSKAQELGLSKDEINMLAGKSPAAVLTMFGLSGAAAPKQASTLPPPGTVRSESFQGTPTSYIGRETHVIPLGGSHSDQKVAFDNSRKMVDELKNQGLSIYDLEDPSTFFKYMR